MTLKPKTKFIIAYKFHRFNMHLVELLTTNGFHCSKQEELNDPLDGKIKITRVFLFNFFYQTGNPWIISYPNLVWEKFIEQYDSMGNIRASKEYKNESLKEINDKVDFISEKEERMELFAKILMNEYDYRIVSLVRGINKKYEKLMWAHYTSGFEGVRLRFRIPNSLFHLDRELYDIDNMQYERMPKIRYEEDIKKYFNYKYNEWKYENELRIILRHEDSIGFRQSWLKEIVFGIKVKNKDVAFIVCLCERLKYNIKYFKLEPRPSGFRKKEITKHQVKDIVKNRGDNAFRLTL